MKQAPITRAALGRLPFYLRYLKSESVASFENVSATTIAKALGFGEVQVRKDLNLVSGAGKPKIGYVTDELIKELEKFLCVRNHSRAVIVGAGKLGKSLLHYDGFEKYGLEISAAFDCNVEKCYSLNFEKNIYPIEKLNEYCTSQNIRIGIITVPEEVAQLICDKMVESNIKAIWNFASCTLKVPDNVLLQQENLALSLAHLNLLMHN